MSRLARFALAFILAIVAPSLATAQCGIGPHAGDVYEWVVPNTISIVEPLTCGPRTAVISVYNPVGNGGAKVTFNARSQYGSRIPVQSKCVSELDGFANPYCTQVQQVIGGNDYMFYVDVDHAGLRQTDILLSLDYIFLDGKQNNAVQAQVAYTDCNGVLGNPTQLLRRACR